MIRFILLSLPLFFVFSLPAFSQKEVRKELKKGNKEYKQEKYTEAEINYRKALELNARSKDAAYNLGNSLYKQSKFEEAMQQYQAALTQEKDKNFAAAGWHNIGNIFMNNKEYQKSVDAYKQSLRLNPNDDETRYNLALAQKLLENQQQQNDQNKDKQDQQNKDERQKQDQDQQKQDRQQDKQDQQQQQNPNEMQKENAEQILNAMMQNERNTQEKVKAEQIRQQKQRKTKKNW
jgi:tetratricopeptide (TPR) repeat protein